VLAAILAAACRDESSGRDAANAPSFSIDYEKYTLDNGLDVVLHIDRSDPIVAVAMTYHVGSARERPGKTGFAHLFEHLMFLDSENLGPGGLDILIDRLGGTLNGSTSRDRTNYYQVVPNDGLEKILWAEADKLGFFINTVTDEVVAKEKQVVKNEKRQSYDNQPYGHTGAVVGASLYPEGHPYSWQVIGSLADLDGATLNDVHEFHSLWYAPNNATLAIAGDFDIEQAKEWVATYFGEIPASELPDALEVEPVVLDRARRLFHEDNYATVPELRLTWPTVPVYHADSYPLEMLATLVSAGKKAPLYEVIVEEEELAPSVSMNSFHSELAGEMTIAVRAFAGTDLDEVGRAIEAALERFETDGFDESDLDRVKAGLETGFYNGLSSILGKAFELAQYNIFAGSPGYIEEDITRILDVTSADVRRVYEQYVKDRNFIATSFVPSGQPELTLADSELAEVRIEPIVTGAEGEIVLPAARSVERTASAFDRSVEPPFGDGPALPIPQVWNRTLSNQVRVLGIVNSELPLVRFTIRVDGGLLLDDPDKVGVANLTAELLTEGTAGRTPEDLEEAIDALGSSITVSAGRESLTLSGTALRRNYAATMALVEDILLEPRWDETEFERIRSQVINALEQQAGQPTAISANVYNRILYGEGHIFSQNRLGTVQSVRAITIADLGAYYAAAMSPIVASVHFAGDLSEDEAMQSLAGLEQRWEARDVPIPGYPLPGTLTDARLYFVDVPGASQSVIRVGAMGPARTERDFYPATVMNLRLGGTFTSELNQVLREQRGYTYGASSGFSGTRLPGPFTASTSVRSNVTLESLEIIRDILAGYPDRFDASDLETTRSYLVRSNARAFETLGDQIGMLSEISAYGLPFDYVREEEEIVRGMTIDRVRELARLYADPDRMVYLVVGDAETQLPRLRQLGMGEPILLEAAP
jgi:zinc protease